MTVDTDTAQENSLLADDTGNIVDDTQIIIAYDAKCDGVLAATLASPASLDDTVSEALTQLWGIGTVLAMNLYAASAGYEAKDVVTIDGLATTCHLEVEAFQLLVDDNDVFTSPRKFVLLVLLHHKLLGAHLWRSALFFALAVTQLGSISIQHLLHGDYS